MNIKVRNNRLVGKLLMVLQNRGVHRAMKFYAFITICMLWFKFLWVVGGMGLHLPAWCCTAGWPCAAGGWPPPAAAARCGTGAGWRPPPLGSAGRSGTPGLPEPLASGTPSQTADARNEVSATINQFFQNSQSISCSQRKMMVHWSNNRKKIIIYFLNCIYLETLSLELLIVKWE